MWYFCEVLDKMEVVSLGYPLGMFGVSFGIISWLIRGRVDAEPRRVGRRYETGQWEVRDGSVGGTRRGSGRRLER